MTVMDFAKFTLIRWKDFGRCCDRGSGHTVVSRKKSYRTTSRFFNSSTTLEMAVEKKASLAAEKFVLAVEKKAT